MSTTITFLENRIEGLQLDMDNCDEEIGDLMKKLASLNAKKTKACDARQEMLAAVAILKGASHEKPNPENSHSLGAVKVVSKEELLRQYRR